MSITKKIRASAVVCMVAMLAACQGVPIKLSTDTTPVAYNANVSTVEAKSCGFQLLMLIPINVNKRHARAWSTLQMRAHGAALTDVKVMDEWFWAGVGTIYCTTLSATASSGMIVTASRVVPATSPSPVSRRSSTENVAYGRDVSPASAQAPVPVPVTEPAPVMASPVAVTPEPVIEKPTPQLAHPSSPAVAPAMSQPQAGQANTKDGASLRATPVLASAGGKIIAILPAGTIVTLKQKVSNQSGVWWYVSNEAKGEGWVREGELDKVQR